MSTQMEIVQIVLLRESLRKQLDEYELLNSIYSMPGEFQSDNPFLVKTIQDFLGGKLDSVNEKLDFRIKIQLTEKIKMELSVMLGQLYPSHEQPILTIRTDSLNKNQETLIKRAIENHIETEIDKSDPYIYQIIIWLQDSVEDILKTENNSNTDMVEEEEKELAIKMERVWLWSHHIYSKIKRQNIVKLCKSNKLSGFMWPGKPGVICIEGTFDNVEEVTKAIKSWQWQKLKIVKIENCNNDVEGDFSRFSGFEEILTGDGDDGEDVKMDTGRFFKYLENHQSSNMKMELFGFE